MIGDANKVTPIHYPVKVASIRFTEGHRRWLAITDHNDEEICRVSYSDRHPQYHLTCMRTAQAIADALNLAEINIVTDGKPKLRPVAPPTVPPAVDNWKSRALAAEASNRRDSQRSLEDSWELSNLREDARKRRDEEIGRMGGGG